MIDLREYFPDNLTLEMKKQNGVNQARYLLLKNPAGYESVYQNFQNLGKPGSLYLWRKQYWNGQGWDLVTDGLLFFGDDMSVTEVGDWMYTPAGGVVVGYKKSGANSGLLWSGAGGLSDQPIINEVQVWQQNTPGAAYAYHQQDAYGKCGIVEALPEFTPKFGRAESGEWLEGAGTTYADVVRVVMYHGTRRPNQPVVRCESSSPIGACGPYYQSFKNYNTYAIELWLAKGVGIVQENTPFIEDGSYWGIANCRGSVLGESGAWLTYKVEN